MTRILASGSSARRRHDVIQHGHRAGRRSSTDGEGGAPASPRPSPVAAKPSPKPTPAPVLSGSVRGPDGKPVEGAVILYRSLGAPGREPAAMTKTDARGPLPRRPQDSGPGVRPRFGQGPRRARLRQGPARIAAGGDARPRAGHPGSRARLRGRASRAGRRRRFAVSRRRPCPAGTRARSRSRRRRTRAAPSASRAWAPASIRCAPPRAASAPRTSPTCARAPPST